MTIGTNQQVSCFGSHDHNQARRRAAESLPVGYGAAAAILLAALMLPACTGNSRKPLVVPIIIFGVCAAALAVWLAVVSENSCEQVRSSGLWKSILAQLTPAVCLTAAFPAVMGVLGTSYVGSVSVATLVLASSLATPWLSQIVCAPLFTELSDASEESEHASLESRWLSRWPYLAFCSTPIAIAFGVGVGLVLNWNHVAIAALVALCTLNSLFSQSTVVGILQRNYLLWATAWAAYALTLIAFPRIWFMPPVAGLLTQLVYISARRTEFSRPRRTPRILARFSKGALVGGVLWSDKLFFFLRSGPHFQAQFVFLAVLPAIVTYGYYFVRLAPRLDRIVTEMRTTMEKDSVTRSAARLRGLAHQVEATMVQVACVGGILCLSGVVTVSLSVPSVSLLYASMAVASTSFLIITVHLYKLEYVGRVDLMYKFAGAHLVLVAAAILVGAPGSTTYIVASALSAGVAIATAHSALAAWRLPEYALFWRHATQW